jgi:predicted nucleic acid-binding protein
MYLLDTNIVSEMRRPRPHGAVRAWFASVSNDRIFLPSIVAGEIQIGIERTRKSDAGKAADLSDWLDEIVARSQWLEPGPDVFRIWGGLVGRADPALIVDALIAATALHHNMIVVTRNTRDFSPFGVRLLNPFEPET